MQSKAMCTANNEMIKSEDFVVLRLHVERGNSSALTANVGQSFLHSVKQAI